MLQMTFVMQADVAADQIVLENLRASGQVAHASSEESTQIQELGGNAFSVSGSFLLSQLKRAHAQLSQSHLCHSK